MSILVACDLGVKQSWVGVRYGKNVNWVVVKKFSKLQTINTLAPRSTQAEEYASRGCSIITSSDSAKVGCTDCRNHRVSNSGVMALHSGFNWIRTIEAGPARHITATRNGLLESQYRKTLIEEVRPPSVSQTGS